MADLKKIKRAVEQEFSQEEIERFIKIAESVVEKTVLHTVAAMIGDAAGKPADVRDKLRDDVLALIKNPGSRPLPVPVTDENGAADGSGDEILVFFSTCKKDWATKVAVPNQRVGAEVYARYEYIRKSVHSFWNSFAAANKDICRRIVDFMPEIDWKVQPALPTTSTVFYFDPASPHRMGILCAFLHEGQIYPFDN